MTEIRTCPECGCGVRLNSQSKFLRHERGLAYVPYKLYHKFARITGSSVKEQVKNNLCSGSGQGV